MRRSRSGIFNVFGLMPNRAAPMTILCYIVVIAAVFSNLIAICFFSVSVIVECQRNIAIAPRERSQGPSSSPTLNEIITNVTRQGSEEMISLTALLKILQVFKEEDLHLRYSYIDAVLVYNNVSVDLHSLLECYRQKPGREATGSVHGSHSFSAEDKDLSGLHHRNNRQSGSLHPFPIQNNTSLANTSIKHHTSFSNQTSSSPKLKPSNRTSSSQAKKRDIAFPIQNNTSLTNTSIRQTPGKETTSSVHGSHSFSAENKNLSGLHLRNNRQSGSLHPFPIQNNTSLANASIRHHTSFSNQTSSSPKLIPSNRTSSSQTKKRDFANATATSNTSIALQRNKIDTKNVQQKGHLPSTSVSSHRASCVNYSNNLVGRFKLTIQEKTPQQLTSMFPKLQIGGRFTPTDCTPKENTAIIFPYRNRYSHLHILLLNIVPLLMKQNIKFTLFIIEQDLPGIFNRAMLFNIGFLEAQKVGKFDCFIFHDADIIPINDHNFYHCNDQPTHFLSGVNKFKYKLPYPNMFGGVVALTLEQFNKINGASNLYFGWGGEDDDLQIRVTNKGYKVIRKKGNIGHYDMIKHSRDNTNNVNPLRKQMLKFTTERQDVEGLHTTIYTRKSVEMLPLYTWIKVAINMTRVLQTAPTSMHKLRDQLLKHFLPAEQNRIEV